MTNDTSYDGLLMVKNTKSLKKRIFTGIRTVSTVIAPELTNRIRYYKLTNLLAEQIAEKCHVGVDWLLFGDENKKEFPVDRRMEAFLWKHKELREKIYRMMDEE